MTAKGAHKSQSKTGTPRRTKAKRPARKAPAPKPVRPGSAHSKRGAPLTSLFTTPTPIDSIEALTGPDPIVDDSNGPDKRRRK